MTKRIVFFQDTKSDPDGDVFYTGWYYGVSYYDEEGTATHGDAVGPFSSETDAIEAYLATRKESAR